MGHSANDRTRISAALLSSTDGNVDLPGSNAYTGFFAGSQAFDVGRLGTQRVGFYAMVGQAPTNTLTSGWNAHRGRRVRQQDLQSRRLQRNFLSEEIGLPGRNPAWLGQRILRHQLLRLPDALPAGARSAVWNGAFVETHYVYSPQLIFIQRSEWIRMSQQAIPGTASNLGNIDNYVFGYRYMPFMNSRAASPGTTSTPGSVNAERRRTAPT